MKSCNKLIQITFSRFIPNIHFIHPIVIASLFLLFSGCTGKYDELDVSMYHYRDTKNLVKFVYDAAKILEKEGLAGLEYFHENREHFRTKDTYLYIYDLDFNCVFHSGMENLENLNLWSIIDKNGKKVAALTFKALEDETNPHSWIHYTWWEPGKFFPVPKSSCHFRVTTPEGKEYCVGGGINYPQEEQEFMRINVDNAAELIEEKGHDAFDEISDPTSEYNYREVSIFAFGPDGKILISPVLEDSLAKIELLECTDEVGNKPFVKAVNELQTNDSVWEVFLAKNRFRRELVKKCMYIRKAVYGDEIIYVGAVTDLPNPP
ncbi:MAG: cache domain-containing protein [Candidatus Cloacimonetes bacterium]|nr:cache domain-containing protein [Candidatus Cloacimonadota bacterium]